MSTVNTIKGIQLNKKSVWVSKQVALPDGKGGVEYRKSALYKLPANTKSIETIAIDNQIVYNAVDQVSTSSIGTGGRFYHKRSMIDGQVVFQQLLLRDFKGTQVKVVLNLIEEEK